MRPLRFMASPRRFALGALVVALLPLQPRCGCSDATAFFEGFEGCTNPCGFTPAGGGSTAIVSTILPGEHALRLTGPITATRLLAPTPTIDTSYVLALVTDCTSGLTVSLNLSYGSSEGAASVPLALDETPDSSGQLPDYTGARYLPESGTVTLPTSVTSAQVTAIVLTVDAGATCTVDAITLAALSTCSE